MKIRVTISALAALLLGLFIATHHTFTSGLNPVLVQNMMAILVGVVLFNIFKSPTKKQKLIQVLILSAAVAIGTKIMVDSAEHYLDGYMRNYYQLEE